MNVVCAGLSGDGSLLYTGGKTGELITWNMPVVTASRVPVRGDGTDIASAPGLRCVASTRSSPLLSTRCAELMADEDDIEARVQLSGLPKIVCML